MVILDVETVAVIVIITILKVPYIANGACFTKVPPNKVNEPQIVTNLYEICSENCDENGACRIVAGQPFPVQALFSVEKEQVNSVHVHVLLGMFFQYFNEDACSNKDVSCPIPADMNTTYTKIINIPTIQPVGTYDVMIRVRLNGIKAYEAVLKGVVATKT